LKYLGQQGRGNDEEASYRLY
jgi:hypothetical protein